MRTDDGSVVQRCINGEPVAFGILVDKYKAGIYAFIYDKLHNFQDAQDVTQEVFLEAYHNLSKLRRWESFGFWLYRIAHNQCGKWLRSQSKRPDLSFIEDQDSKALGDSSLNSHRESQLNETLMEALDCIPESYREALMLYYFGGMSVKEIARFIGISPTAIRMRLSRARMQLKEEMIAMMDTAFEEQKLRSSFTFQIVEMIKQIRIQSLPPKTLPWGLSLATGLIIAILGIGAKINITNTMDYISTPSLTGETKVLDASEFPVDIINISDATVISTQQSPGSGLDNVIPDLQNALFMAAQAEGGTWTKKANMPTKKEGMSCNTVNGKVYLIGGIIDGKASSQVDEYDPIEDKWIKKSDMPTIRYYLSSSVVGGKIYAIGGEDWPGFQKILSIVAVYDPLKDEWTKRADMPTERNNLSTSVVNGKIYAIGGLMFVGGKAVILSTVEEYDPSVDKWTKKSDMPTARYGLITETVKGKIYAIGGIPSNGIVEEYDPSTDTWTKKANMPTSRGWLTSGIVNDKIYAIGGLTKWPESLSTVEEYDPSTDTWLKKNDMPTPRIYLSTSELDNRIYVFGGHDAEKNISLSTVEEFDPGLTGKGVDFKGKLPTTWGDIRTAMNK